MPLETENILDAMPAACASVDERGELSWMNLSWRRLFGIGIGLDGRTALSDWFPEEPSVGTALREVAGSGGAIRLQARRSSGVPFTIAIMTASDPGSGDLVCVGREIAGSDLLSESQRYLDVAFEMAPLGMALFDTDGRYVRVNDALCRLLGRTRAELIGMRDQELTHPDDRQSDVDAAWRILNGEFGTWQTEKRFITSGGDTVWTIANLVFLRDADGHPLSWLGHFQDITEHKRREELLRHVAAHDELMSIANRRGIIEQLTNRLAYARRYDEPGAVLIIDLDGFKEINDRGGHQAGDAALAQAARVLAGRLRATDFIGRLGGDEFAVILPHADMDGARTVGEALLRAVRELQPYRLRASCGVSLYDAGSATVDRVLADADRAMYRAKALGGDCVSIAPADSPQDGASRQPTA